MTSFDRNTGVVYTETTSAPAQSMVTNWASQARGRGKSKRYLRSHGTGCSSLQDMATRACAWNVELFLPETLKWAGWSFAGKIWREMKQSKTVTFNAWNLFMEALPEEIEGYHPFRINAPDDISVPTQLPSIIDRLSRINGDTLTFLSLRGVQITFDHLISLTRIPTLAVLELAQPRSVEGTITAKNIRDWARAVQESGAFEVLSALSLDNVVADYRATVRAITTFPALNLLRFHPPRAFQVESRAITTEYGEWKHGEWSMCREYPWVCKEPARHCHVPGISDITSSEVLKWLHDTSQETHPQPMNRTSIGISYLGSSQPVSYERYATWYHRLHMKEQEEVMAKHAAWVKRKNDSGQNTDPRDQNKKRRIKSEKQNDVGALLGSFM